MRTSLILLAITGTITVLMIIPEFSILVVVLRFGLALPLVFIPTLLLYQLCLIPLPLLWDRTKLMGVILSAVFVARAAFIPAGLGNLQSKLLLAEHANGNIQLDQNLTARSVEIQH